MRLHFIELAIEFLLATNKQQATNNDWKWQNIRIGQKIHKSKEKKTIDSKNKWGKFEMFTIAYGYNFCRIT